MLAEVLARCEEADRFGLALAAARRARANRARRGHQAQLAWRFVLVVLPPRRRSRRAMVPGKAPRGFISGAGEVQAPVDRKRIGQGDHPFVSDAKTAAREVLGDAGRVGVVVVTIEARQAPPQAIDDVLGG